MAPVTLPASFYNSFWSPDYRTGLDVLFRQLEKGTLENADVAAFILVGLLHLRRQLVCASLPRWLAGALASPPDTSVPQYPKLTRSRKHAHTTT
jgi:hypothetical protein